MSNLSITALFICDAKLKLECIWRRYCRELKLEKLEQNQIIWKPIGFSLFKKQQICTHQQAYID